MSYFRWILKPICLSLALALISNEFASSQTLGQNLPKTRPTSPAVQNASAPVTRSEVFAIFRKVDQAVAKSIIKAKTSSTSPNQRPGVASRSEIISEFHRVYQLCKPRFKYTSNPGLTEPQLITIPITDPSRKMIDNLISWGFIGRYDPIATSKTTGMLPVDFGFAVAQFLGRLCELTHTPSSKFSPTMMRADG